ncbi:hypothetical protein HYALB_00004532 [Hymenoscyphus albidus]|uniref:Uncharacterized protein n=1 Tax=Hymenoscyphus albidus TaxID=595503 RepID=A0A9N9LXG5_9HELO|nr:hypothetical protein HYALB_00004532 [Hymenoscyphus albidus]
MQEGNSIANTKHSYPSIGLLTKWITHLTKRSSVLFGAHIPGTQYQGFNRLLIRDGGISTTSPWKLSSR